MGRKLYVGNLPYEAGEGELHELFARPKPMMGGGFGGASSRRRSEPRW